MAPELPEREHQASSPSKGASRDYPAWLATAISAIALIQGLTAGPFWKDAGELGASALDMGVAHPTGFSTWGALARIFSWIPLGTLHLRIALASAIPMALCIGLLAYLLRPASSFGKPLDLFLRGVGLPLLALSCPTTWYLGTTPEVYALASLLCLSWLLAFHAGVKPQQKFRYGGLILGLVPGVHITALFGAISIPTSAGFKSLKAWLKTPSLFLNALPTFFLSAAGVLAITQAARRNPDLNFDNPETLEGLWRHISAQGIQERFASESARPNFTEILELHQSFLMEELGLSLIVAGIAGIFLGSKTRIGWSLSLIALADMSYNLFINPMGRRDLQTGALTALCLSALAILSVQAISSLLPKWQRSTSTIALIALVLSTSGPFLHEHSQRQAIASDPTPLQLSRKALAPLAPGALIFTSSDDVIGLLYASRRIEGRRPDIAQVLTSFAWWPWHLEKQGLKAYRPATPPESDQEQIQILKKILREENPKRMIAWEPGAGVLDSVVGTRLQPGLLFGPIMASAPDSKRWGSISKQAQSTAAEERDLSHPWSKRVISECLRLNAVNATRSKKEKQSMLWSEEAVGVDATNAAAWNNLGVSHLRNGNSAGALDAMQHAVSLKKHDSRIWRNFGLSLLERKNLESARSAFRRAKETAKTPRDSALAKELLDRTQNN